MSLIINSFKRLVLAHLEDITGSLMDPPLFAYHANMSVDLNAWDCITVLQHFDSPGTYARILFVDISSAINIIIPDILHSPSSQSPNLPLNHKLPYEPEAAGGVTSSTQTISTGAPQGCVLSPLLFFLYTTLHLTSAPSR